MVQGPGKGSEDLKLIRAHVNGYSHALDGVALYHLVLTAIGCVLVPLTYGRIFWAFRPLVSLLQGLFVVKCFIIFHDCGHRSYFSSTFLNNIGHQITSRICMTPCNWANTHNQHHAVSANMDQDEYPFNETVFHTVRDYKAFSPLFRMVYRIGRDPLVFYFGGAVFKWFLYFNIPFIVNPDYPPLQCVGNAINYAAWLFAVAKLQPEGHALTGAAFTLLGWILGASLGVALFHTQHSYNPAYVKKTTDAWSHHDAGLKGSSVAFIPWPLKWFTMGIEYHNFHHFSTRVPGYRLQECYETCPPNLLKSVGTVCLTPGDMWASLKNVLYDDEKDRFVNFAEIH